MSTRMYLDDDAPILGGRELWGFPKKHRTAEDRSRRRRPRLHAALRIVSVCVGQRRLQASYHRRRERRAALAEPGFLLKIIPHVDGTPRICELVAYAMTDIVMKGAWSSPAALELHVHVACDVARLPVREIVSATHFRADMTTRAREVVHDYLAK